jgi:hypothetical protein
MAINALTASYAAGVPSGGEQFRAPLFWNIAERLREGGRWVVLDLGPPRSGNVEFFSRFRSRLTIANVGAGLGDLNAAADASEAKQVVEALLPAHGPDPIDLVLCWDVLNFLKPPALSALMAQIATGLRRGASVHALMAYAATQMPAEPGSYAIRGEGELASSFAGEGTQNAPGYSTYHLLKMMPNFQVEKSVLLRQGLQEYFFRYWPPVATAVPE